MAGFFFAAAVICMLAVAGSLFRGIFAMARGSKKDHQTSHKMMRSRVLFQGLAIFFLFLAYLAKH
jgi:hypothetical protein